jgi:hypothetical protein
MTRIIRRGVNELNKRVMAITMMVFIMGNLLGCNGNNNNKNEGLKIQDEIQINYGTDEVGEIREWQGEIKGIKKHRTRQGYSVVEWKGVKGGGSFSIEDDLVYGKYNLQVGEYIDVVAQDIRHGLRFISIEKIEARTAIRGIIEGILIEDKASRIFIKVIDEEKFDSAIIIEVGEDTKFPNAPIDSLKKLDLISAIGVLKESTLKSDEVTLISSFNVN